MLYNRPRFRVTGLPGERVAGELAGTSAEGGGFLLYAHGTANLSRVASNESGRTSWERERTDKSPCDLLKKPPYFVSSRESTIKRFKAMLKEDDLGMRLGMYYLLPTSVNTVHL